MNECEKTQKRGFMFDACTLSVWKIITALVVQTAGVIWFARGVVDQADTTALALDKVKVKMAYVEQEQRVIVANKTRLQIIDKRLDRIEDKLDGILGKLSK